MRRFRVACLLVVSLSFAAPTLAQPRTMAGMSPPPMASATPAKPRTASVETSAEPGSVTVTGRRHRGLFHRIGHFFSRIFHGKRRWYTTPSHRAHCQQSFRSYNAKTNSYRAHSGVRRVCVI